MGGIDLGKGLDLEKPRTPRSGIGLEIGKSPAGNLGIGVEIPLPVTAPVSARGGVSIDPSTGEIRGGYGGLGIGKGPIGGSVDVGVDTPAGSDKLGCFKYVTVTLGPFSHTFGKNECEPKEQEKKPKPPGTGLPPGALSPQQIDEGMLTTTCGIVCVTLHNYFETDPENPYVTGTEGICFKSRPVIDPVTNIPTGERIAGWDSEYINQIYYPEDVDYSLSAWDEYFKNDSIGTIWDYYTVDPGTRSQCFPEAPPSSSFPPVSFSPPIPNPPPTKKKMNDDCCKALIALQLETLRLLGREIGLNGLLPQTTKKGFIGEEIERTQTPIKDATNPEKFKIKFSTVYELLMYSLKQANDLDTALDPKSYQVPTGKLQNPAYSRDSEQSLKSNNQPNKDKAGNKRELEINKDDEAKMSGFLQQQSYMFQMLKRLEYLFPPGELEDAVIAKSLLVAGAKGDVKIHNMIQAFEIQMQYLNSIFGDPRELITIKDANPGLKGDQSIEVKCLSISSMLREIIKFQIDTGGDVDSSINLAIRIFRTVMANRIDIVKTGEAVQAIFEDTGMLEKMDWLDLHLEGDPYAGQWKKGEGFKPTPDLEEKTEEATEKVLLATMVPGDIRIKVSRRSKDEKTDIRDLIRGLADFMQRLFSIPSAGDATNTINKLIESAKFKVQTDMALIRQNVTKAASASRSRTRKRKK
ncbi:hypothetical protein [Microcoleus sp. herbarium14]|uniref:hypothetical protein n=1 Tax=Microcoleus sp. herbarium14 TaxID=3055439 RepID=UPI002FD008BC